VKPYYSFIFLYFLCIFSWMNLEVFVEPENFYQLKSAAESLISGSEILVEIMPHSTFNYINIQLNLIPSLKVGLNR